MNALPPLITEHLEEVRALCARHSVKSLAIFGSAAKGNFDSQKSDIDFVVEFLPGTPVGGLRGPYFNLLTDLQDLFGRSVDLVERDTIDNPYFAQVVELSERHVYDSTAA